MTYNGKQLFMAFINKKDADNILNILSKEPNIEYYIYYNDTSIKDYYFIYFQSPKIQFAFTNKYKSFCHLYYRNKSELLIEYIRKCNIIKEYGNYNKLRTNLTRNLIYNEFKNISDIQLKVNTFYNKTKSIISEDENDIIINDCNTEIDSDTYTSENKKSKTKFKPIFTQKHQPIINTNINNIHIDLWKNNISYNTKQIKVLYFYGLSDVNKTEKIKQYIKNEDYGNTINVLKYDGEYWYGVGTSNIAVYDNFKEKQLNIFELLDFIDNEIHDLKTKNGFVKNNYQLIIFNSIESIEYCYINASDELRQKLISSMKIIKC